MAIYHNISHCDPFHDMYHQNLANTHACFLYLCLYLFIFYSFFVCMDLAICISKILNIPHVLAPVHEQKTVNETIIVRLLPICADSVRNAVLRVFVTLLCCCSLVAVSRFVCPRHLCLCIRTSWRWHDSCHLRVPLQGVKSFCNSFQGRCSCIVVTRRCAFKGSVKFEALKDPS